MSDIPTGNTMEVVLDRMQRAGNFASNGAYMVTEKMTDLPDVDMAQTYINAARRMLDEAQTALDAA